jgi:hypothetical protein
MKKIGTESCEPSIYGSGTIFIIFYEDDFMVPSIKSAEDAMAWTNMFSMSTSIQLVDMRKNHVDNVLNSVRNKVTKREQRYET